MQMEEARTEIASEPLKQIYLVMLGDFESGYGDCKNDENISDGREAFRGFLSA